MRLSTGDEGLPCGWVERLLVGGRRRRGEPGRGFKGSFGRAVCTGREKRRITQKARRGPNQQKTITVFICADSGGGNMGTFLLLSLIKSPDILRLFGP